MKKFNFYAITAEDLENNIKGVSEDLYEFYSVVYGKKFFWSYRRHEDDIYNPVVRKKEDADFISVKYFTDNSDDDVLVRYINL